MAKSASKARGVLRALYVSVLVALVVLSPFAMGLGLALRGQAARSFDRRDSWRGIRAFAVLGSLVYGLLSWLLHPLSLLPVALLRALLSGHLAEGVQPLLLLWTYHALFAPVVSLVLEALGRTAREVQLAPRAVLSRPGAAGQRRPGQGAQTVAGSSSPAFPEAVDGEAVIGRALSGTLWQWVRGAYLVFLRRALSQHAVVVALSGMGKSELLRRIAYIMAKLFGMKVLWIDGKGDWQDAVRFEMTMQRAGCQRVGIFPLNAHAGWRGTRQDVLNLLMATQTFEHDYFRGVTYNILKLALYAPHLPAVESGAELLRRLYPPTLMALYRSTSEHLYLAALTTDALWGPYNKYQAFFSGVQDRLDGSLGFGDWDAAYYLLDEKRLQEAQLAPFARYLIDDFSLYLALRQLEGKQRPLLLVLDDFSAYSSRVTVHKLYERVRSSHGCVILSAQGYEGLGEDAERLIEDAATTILGKCNLPEKLIRVAGKKKVPALSYHLPGEREEQGLRSGKEKQPRLVMHEEERWLVEADEVRGLGVGEAYLLYGPAAHKVAVERVRLDEDAVERRAAELLRDYEEAQAKYEADQARIPRRRRRNQGALVEERRGAGKSLPLLSLRSRKTCRAGVSLRQANGQDQRKRSLRLRSRHRLMTSSEVDAWEEGVLSASCVLCAELDGESSSVVHADAKGEDVMGIFLLLVTVLLELAGAAWSYWYGSHVSAGLAGLLYGALGMFPGLQRYHIHIAGMFIGWSWVALYGLIHLAAVYGYVKSIAKRRLKMGRPGQRETTVVDRACQDLAAAFPASGLGPVSRLAWPRSFDYLPGYDLTLFFLGSRLIIGEGLFTHQSLKPLLAQQLFAYNSGDVRLRVVLDCLPPGKLFVAPLGAVLGLPVGIGPVLTVLCWKRHWRDRVYAGDLFAARLGQRYELIQALDQVIRPHEQRQNVLLREYPYAAERIDRLMRLAPPGYAGTSPAWASPPPFGSASTASSPPPSGTASSGGKASSGDPASSSSTGTSRASNQPQQRRKEWNAMQSQPVTLILRFADSGWHVRWRTSSTEAFHAVLEEFKDLLDLTERYWDPEAFDKGGWWVAYGALGKVGHLFSNYEAARDELEREHRQRYEQQRKEARSRAAQSEQKKERGQQTKQQNQQPGREEKREEAKLPRTPQEAFRILSLVPPVTLNDVKRAYRAKAFTCHPDRGGSHAQMVVINAAFELAQKAVS